MYLNLGISLLGPQLRNETVPSYAAVFILEKKKKTLVCIYSF